jgi:NDP-sugar pyrophosphorylase family protein
MMGASIKTAFILGAGLGVRLRPLTDTCPKPLLPAGGRPLITYAMEHLLTVGVERFIVNIHHLAGVYQEVFPGGEWRGRPVIFRYEPLLLDTAGGLKNIEDLLDQDDNLLIYNGDVVSDLPLCRLLNAHQEAGKEVTLALRSSGFPANVRLNEQNEACDFRGTLGREGKKCLFTGIYVIKKAFLYRLEPGRRESVITVFLDMIREKPGAVAGAVIDEGRWHDAGSLSEYEKLNELLLREKGSGI